MSTLEYSPQGSLGFRVRLGSGSLVLRAESRADGANNEVGGSDALTGNLALVTLVTAYAANELAFRRSRSEEKKASFRNSADEARRDALALTGLIERLDQSTITAWCSGCFARADRRKVRGYMRPKSIYLCSACGTPTVECAVPGCRHHAVLAPRSRMSVRYCAEHRHEIAAFDKLDAKIACLSDYGDFLDFRVRNAERITKVTGGTIGAAVVVAPFAFMAAPAVGAALGSSALGGSLTGAAATGHGLAMLGGGAIASGGLGMAGGTAVVTATGTALGGALGAATASAYAGADDTFSIDLVRPGQGRPVVFATGFLTEGVQGWATWERLIDTKYPDSPVYQVHWGAKELKALSSFVALWAGKAMTTKALARMALRGSKLHTIPGIGPVLAARDLATNPWTVAKTRAGMTGAVLAVLLTRSIEGPYVLIGHSLGARVMVAAAEAMASRSEVPRIESMHLLGAAVGRRDVLDLQSAVSGTIWNYRSENDQVLRWLYRVAELGDVPVGRSGFGSTFARIKDRNVTRQVGGHSEYAAKVTLAG